MRGKAILRLADDFQGGITPAYAGKSWTSHGVKQPAWDHPRVCGEKHQMEPQAL